MNRKFHHCACEIQKCLPKRIVSNAFVKMFEKGITIQIHHYMLALFFWEIIRLKLKFVPLSKFQALSQITSPTFLKWQALWRPNYSTRLQAMKSFPNIVNKCFFGANEKGKINFRMACTSFLFQIFNIIVNIKKRNFAKIVVAFCSFSFSVYGIDELSFQIKQ